MARGTRKGPHGRPDVRRAAPTDRLRGDDVPWRLGPYELEGALPAAGPGRSFRARDTRRDRVVVLRLLPRAHPGDRAVADRLRERLSPAAGLTDPHVVPVHDFGLVAGWPYVDTRLVDGEPLADVLRRDGPLSPERAVHVVAQVAEALDAAHEAGLVHGALGPASVSIGPHDFVYVTDLGVAGVDPRQPGTVPYPAPEQLAGERVDRRADVHALACLLAEMLAGSPPRQDSPAFTVRDHRHGGSAAAPPGPLAEVVRRGTAPQPEERFATAGALAAAAVRAVREQPPAAPVRPVVAAAPGAGRGPGPAAPPPRSGSQVAREDDRRRAAPWHGRRGAVAAAAASVLVVGLVVVAAVAVDRTDTGDAGAGGPAAVVVSPPAPTGAPGGGGSAAPDHAGHDAVVTTTPAASRPDPELGPAVPVGRQPHEVVLAPDARTAWVPDPASGTVVVVDPATAATVGTIPVPDGPPQMVTFSPDGRTAYVSVFDSGYTVNRIVVVDTASRQVQQSIAVGRGPYAAAATPDGRLLYVPLFDEPHLDVVDTGSGAVIGRVEGAPNPHWIAFSRDGRQAWTANHASGMVSLLDVPANRVVTTVRVGDGPHSVELSPDGSQLAVADYISGEVTLIDTATATVGRTVRQVGNGPQDVTYAPDGRHLYTANVNDGTVSVVDTTTGAVTARLDTGKSPTSVAALPDGRTALVSVYEGGTLQVIRTG